MTTNANQMNKNISPFIQFCKDTRTGLKLDYPDWTSVDIFLELIVRWKSLTFAEKNLFGYTIEHDMGALY